MYARFQGIVAASFLLLIAAVVRGEEKKDLFGDPLPPGAIARLGSVRFATASNITAAAVSQDEKSLLACTTDVRRDGASQIERSVVYLWDAKTGAEQHRIDAIEGTVLAMTMPSDRKSVWLILKRPGHDERVFLRRYIIDEKRWLDDVSVPKGTRPRRLWFSADETLVVVDSYTSGQVLDRDAKTLRSYSGRSSYCPATGLMASTAHDAVEVWRAVDSKLEHSIPIPRAEIEELAFSADGRRLAVVEKEIIPPALAKSDRPRRDVVKLFDETGKHLSTRTIRASAYSRLFSPNGALLADGHVWKTANGERVDTDVGRPVAFLDKGKRFVTAQAHCLQIRDTKTWKVEVGHQPGFRYRENAVSPDESLLVTMNDGGKIELWEIASGKHRWNFTPPGLDVSSVTFASDGKHLLLGSRGQLSLCPVDEPKIVKQVSITAAALPMYVSLTRSADGKRIAAGRFDGVDLVSADLRYEGTLDPGHRRQFQTGRFSPSYLEFSPDGKFLAALDAKNVAVWDVESKKQVFATAASFPRTPIGFRDDRRLVFVERGYVEEAGRRMKTIDVSTGKEVESVELKPGYFPSRMTVIDRLHLGVERSKKAGDHPLPIAFSDDTPFLKFEKDHFPVVIGLPKTRRLILGHANGTALVFELPPKKAVKD